MDKFLVKIHKAYSKGYCIGIGVVLLMFALCFLLMFMFPLGDDWFSLILFVICVALAIIFFAASSDDYEEYEEWKPPMYYSVDQYGRMILTNGKETVLLEEKPAERRINLQVNTVEEAKETLKMIEAYFAEDRISKEDYDRVKAQLEEFLAKGEVQEKEPEIEKSNLMNEDEDKDEEDYQDEAHIDTIFDCYPDLYDRFKRLKELYDNDLITEWEYAEKKEQLLDEL